MFLLYLLFPTCLLLMHVRLACSCFMYLCCVLCHGQLCVMARVL